MNSLKKLLALGACVAAFALAAPKAVAQWQPPSPEEMRQQMMDKIRDRLSLTNDDEWQAIQPKIQKAMDAAQDLMKMRDMSTIMPDFGAMRRRNREGGDNNGDNNNNDRNNGNNDRQPRRRRGGGFGMFGGEPAPSVAALNKAIEDHAPKDEIKTKLEGVRAELKDKEAKLAAAREDLRSVLTTRQEAALVVSGILD